MLDSFEWMTEIENALEYRRQFAMEESWRKLELDYINHPNSDCNIGPNLVYSMGDSLLSSLVVPDPEILLEAEHPSAVKRKPVTEAVDNWLVKKLRMKKHVEDSVMNSYLYSRGILKIGYDSEFGWSPYYDIGEANNMMGMTFTQFSKKGNRIERMNTEPGMPWVAAVNPHDIVVPWGTREIDDAPWIAHRVIRLNDHIKADAKYSNTSRLEPRVSMASFMESYGHVMSKNKRSSAKNNRTYANNKKPNFNILWEIHDKMSGKIFVVSPDYDKFLRKDDNALQIGGELPFVSGTLVNHPRSFWCTPQAYYLGQIQHIQKDISLQAEKQRRLNSLKFLAQKNSMSQDEMNKLISGDVGAIGLVDTAQPLQEVFQQFPQGSPLPFEMESRANREDAREAMGFSRNQLGAFSSSSRRTATEASLVKQGSDTRVARRMNVVINMYTEAIRKINKIAFTYWRLPRYIMSDGQWVKYTGRELRGDYLYDVTLSTKRRMSKAQRKIESLQMMAQLAQVPGVNLEAMKQYVADASGDPAFPSILGLQNKTNQNVGERAPSNANVDQNAGGMQNAGV